MMACKLMVVCHLAGQFDMDDMSLDFYDRPTHQSRRSGTVRDVRSNLAPYFETVQFLEGLANVRGRKDFMEDQSNPDLYLKRMRYFLDLIGNPHKRNFKYIHIAGTSGKGSTVAMLYEALRAVGKNVGSFTSPFITTTIEKIKVNDKYISPDEFVEIVDYLKPYIDQAYLSSPYGGPSYFEILNAVGFLYFAKKKCEWVILEVGCGGRYDATNVIEKPVATAVTSIDFDHTKLLGNTLKKIAYQKAGIMKKGAPFFTTEQRPHLLKVFKNLAKSKRIKFVPVKAGGDHQNYNEALVKAILGYLKIPNSKIKRPQLPCRFEILQKNPIIVLDGAHSVSKIKSTVENLKKLKFKKLILVLAITASKDIDGICKIIVPHADYVLATRFSMPFRKCANPKELVSACKKYKKQSAKMEMFMDPNQALARALKKAGQKDLVLATGSFFLTGELRKRCYPEKRILKTLRSF